MTKDYTQDYEEAIADIEEEGAVGILSWDADVTTNNTTGVQTGNTPTTAEVVICIFPTSSRGDGYEANVQVRNTRRSFIAAPRLQATEILNGRFITVGGVKYEVEASAPLAPSGAVRILYQGMLRIAG